MSHTPTEEQRRLALQLIEKITEGAVSLTLSRMPEDEEDRVEKEIFEDVRDCLTDEELGCLDPEELNTDNSTLLWAAQLLAAYADQVRLEEAKVCRDNTVTTTMSLEQVGQWYRCHIAELERALAPKVEGATSAGKDGR